MENNWEFRNIFQNLVPLLPISDQIKPINKCWVKIYRSSSSFCLLKECKKKNLMKAFYLACKKNDSKVIDFFEEFASRKREKIPKCSSGYNHININGMYGAAKGGHMDLVNRFIEKGCKHWSSGLEGAIKGKQEDMALFFASKISDLLHPDSTVKLIIRSGFLKVLQIIDAKTETGYISAREGLIESIKAENEDMIDFFLERTDEEEYYFPLEAAVKKGRLDLVKLFGSTGEYMGYIDELANLAALYGQRDVLNFFLSKGYGDWNELLCSAMEGGHHSLVDFFVSKGANNWNKGFKAAIKGGQIEMVKLALSKGVTKINKGLLLTIRYHISYPAFLSKKDRLKNEKQRKKILMMMKFFISKGANNLNKVMRCAVNTDSMAIVNLLVKHGAKNFKSCLKYAVLKKERRMINFFKKKLRNSLLK